MKHTKINKGFTLIELLISLAIMAILFVAIGTAFDTAFKNYDSNVAMNKAETVHRNILHQLSSSLRTAFNDPDIAMITVSDGGNILAFTDASAKQMQYRYDPETSQLLLSIDGSDEYVLLDNISLVSETTDIFTLVPPPLGSGFDDGTVGRVEINFRSDQGSVSKVVSTAVIPRNIVYGQ